MVAWLCLPLHVGSHQNLDPRETSILQMKIKPFQPGIHKIYIDVLQDLKSTIQPEWHPNIQNKHAASDSGFAETHTHNLVELPTVSSPFQTIGLKDQMAILQEMRNLLRDNLIHLPILDLELHCQDMDTLITDAGLLIYSLYDAKGEKEGITLEAINQALALDLSSNIQPIKAMICHITRKVFQYKCPRIHGLGYVDVFLNNLKEFHTRYANSLASVRNQLQIIEMGLVILQPFLKANAHQSQNKIKALQDCSTQLICKAYEVEYVVDAYRSKEIPRWCLEHVSSIGSMVS